MTNGDRELTSDLATNVKYSCLFPLSKTDNPHYIEKGQLFGIYYLP